MKKNALTTLFLLLALTACRKSDDSSENGLNLFGTDDMKEVIELIESANADLKSVKAIYKANQKRVGELKEAINAKDVEKVRAIADDLVLQINEGLVLGQTAVEKIEKAEDLNINATYKDYLRLKRESLGKQLEAFELRRQVAKQLSEIFGRKDPKEIDAVQAVFRDKEENFQKLMDEGKALSQEANQVAKDAARRQ
jgi:hypothetical protein